MKTVWISAVALAALLSPVGAAHAQAQSTAGQLTRSQWEDVRLRCNKEPGHPVCRKLEKACMTNYKTYNPTDQEFCRYTGYSPADHAARQIRKLKDKCDNADYDEGCVELRASCREDRLSCELVKKMACDGQSGPYCDADYLCTPAQLRSVCSGKSDPGSMHLLIHANYAHLDEAGGDFILSGSAIAHGQAGDSMVNLNYVLDMGLGWFKGVDDGLAYDANLLIGVGARKGAKGMVGIAAGGGLNGVAGGGYNNAWTVSAELFAAAEIVSGIDVLGFVRPTWVYREDSRKDGSDALSFADEMTTGVTVTWTRKKNEGNFVSGTGYGLMLFYKELLGVNMIGIGIGSANFDASR